MKALVYNGAREVSVSDVEDSKIESPTDVVIKLTTTNVCGSDLHMYEGRTDIEEGRVLGHENLGGQCNVKAYNRKLRDLIEVGKAKPSFLISHELPLAEAPDAYKHFDDREEGWTKVILKPAA
jgi:threonine dehydrogenase-like Zn-dependent dehydrogenase